MSSLASTAAVAPRVLRPRRSLALTGAVCSTLLVAAALVVHDASSAIAAVFFAICGIVSFGKLDPRGSYLEIEPDRLIVSSLYRRTVVPKEDVARFGVVKLFGTVGIAAKPGRALGRLTLFAVPCGAWDAVLPDTYGLGAKRLAELLEEWRTS